MANDLYWVSALTYAFVLIIIIVNDIRMKAKANAEERAFRLMAIWVIIFCLQDMVWGMCESGVIPGDGAFFAASTVFHLSTVITTFFWLYYVCIYVGERIGRKILYLALDGVVILFEIILAIANFFVTTLFSISNGIYSVGPLRAYTFYSQYAVYLTTGLVTLFYLCKSGKELNAERRDRYRTVFLASLAPILLGIFQLLFVDGPFYSLGCFLSCFLVHSFVVAKDRQDAERRYESELVKKSNNDELTGLYNRRAFDKEVEEIAATGIDPKLVFISMDVNGLKMVNDTYGHAAGDEMLVGAAEWMRRSFSIYGKVFRTGGDEFNAIVYLSEIELEALMRDFQDSIAKWSGKLVDRISVSCGYVTRSELPEGAISEMITLSDERMYAAKAEHYKKKGVDRRGQRDAHTALCALYTKILKINLTEDAYEIVNADSSEMVETKGFSTKISGWLRGFAESGQVHPEDVSKFLGQTSMDNMKAYFASGNSSMAVIYRRKYGEIYRQTMMEIIRANDYSKDNQSMFLYVKTIEE